MNAIKKEVSPVSWTKSVIKVRRMLIKKGVSKANFMLVVKTINDVENWMNCWRPSDEQMANYIKRHQHKIRSLIPGKGSTIHEKFTHEFESIIQN